MSKRPKGDKNIYRALSHPFRRELIRFMQRSGEPIAPIDYVRAHGVKGKSEENALSLCAYHLRALEKDGLVDLVKQEQKRGAIKHYYGLGDRLTSLSKDTLAMDEIASVLEVEAKEVTTAVLVEIRKIVASTGRAVGSPPP